MRPVQTMLAEPRVEDRPERVLWDWLLVAVSVPTVIVEMIVRDDLVHPAAGLLLGLGMAIASLWRRSHPLPVLVGVFAGIVVVDLVELVLGGEAIVLYSAIIVVLSVVYAPFRWGSGREAAIALGVLIAMIIHSQLVDFTGATDAIAGVILLLATAELGWLVRAYHTNRSQRREQIRLYEREQLARELHDTVAHRVSAIAISAQAGQVVAETSPAKAAESLAVIEEEAARALAEMRSIVGRLRIEDRSYTPPELAPGPGLADIEHLATSAAPEALHVDVELSGDLDNLGPSIEATAYRLAQESVTNAVRHASNATRVQVAVTGDPDTVRLTVCDDGDSSSPPPTDAGYGVLGMAERVALVGGTLEAGPSPGRGWRVEAVLPKGLSR